MKRPYKWLWRHWRTKQTYVIESIERVASGEIVVFYRLPGQPQGTKQYQRPFREFFGRVDKPGVDYKGKRFTMIQPDCPIPTCADWNKCNHIFIPGLCWDDPR